MCLAGEWSTFSAALRPLPSASSSLGDCLRSGHEYECGCSRKRRAQQRHALVRDVLTKFAWAGAWSSLAPGSARSADSEGGREGGQCCPLLYRSHHRSESLSSVTNKTPLLVGESHPHSQRGMPLSVWCRPFRARTMWRFTSLNALDRMQYAQWRCG